MNTDEYNRLYITSCNPRVDRAGHRLSQLPICEIDDRHRAFGHHGGRDVGSHRAAGSERGPIKHSIFQRIRTESSME